MSTAPSPIDRQEISHEFEGIIEPVGGTRPVMTRPPAPVASKTFIHEVRTALGIENDDAAREAADWILGKMDRYAAWYSEGVFTMDGNGPVCSYCKTIWPLCGHHHLSMVVPDDDGTEGGDAA